jgi:hypothetical protein
VGKTGAYPNEVPFKCFTIEKAPGVTHKHSIWLKKPAKDKHSSLLQKLVNNDRKKFHNIGIGAFALNFRSRQLRRQHDRQIFITLCTVPFTGLHTGKIKNKKIKK